LPEPITTYGILTLVLSTGGLWIREFFKYKSLRKNNGGLQRIEGDVKEIKASTKSLDGRAQTTEKDVGIIKTEVKNIGDNCKKYENGITQNARDILNLHKEKADK